MSHGEVAQEMLHSCEMIVGKLVHVNALSLIPGMSVETFLAKAKEVLQKNEGETLILSDLYGGTPSNVALMLTRVCNAQAITGLNLAMLIEAVMMREYEKKSKLIEIIPQLIITGKEACRHVYYEED